MNRYTTFLSLLIYVLSFQNVYATKRLEHSSTVFNISEIPLTLMAKDKSSGMQLSPKFTVVPVKGGNPLAIKEKDGQFLVSVQVGQSYKIKAELEGYYPFERTLEIPNDADAEGRNVILDMDPQPTAQLSIRVVDEFNQPAEASVRVIASGEPKSGQVSKKEPVFKMLITSPETYRISVVAPQFKTQTESIDIEVNDPPKTYEKIFRLSKSSVMMHLSVLAASQNTPIKNAKVTVTNLTDNIDVLQKVLAEGEGAVEIATQKKYKIKVEAPGYMAYSEEIKANTNEYTARLITETIVNIGTYDRATGTRIPASIKIYTNGKEISDLKGDPFTDALFYPSEKGVYTLKISSKGFKDYEGSINIDALSGNKYPFKANLEYYLEDFVVLVLDEKDKQMITNAEVSIYDANGVGVAVNKNIKTNEWKVALDKSKEYKIQIKAAGYKPFEGDVVKNKSKLVGVSLQKIMQAQYFSAIDLYTKKPLTAQYKVTRPEQQPLQGTSNADSRFMIDIKPNDNYILEVSSEGGYKTQSERLSFAPNTSETSKVFELKKDTYSFSFKVVDAQTKASISAAKMLVQDLTDNTSVQVSANKTGVFDMLLKPENTYQIEVSSEGYENNSSKIRALEMVAYNQFSQDIPLIKNKIDAYRITVIDEEKGSKMSNAQVKIINKVSNEAITATVNPLNSEWLAEINNEQQYKIMAEAENYQPYEGELIQNKDKQISVKLKKIPTNTFTFIAVDALTQKSVLADFKIASTENQPVETSKMADGTKAKATLYSHKNYILSVTADGFDSQQIPLDQKKMENNSLTVALKKQSYDFTFKVINANTKKPVPSPKMSISSDDASHLPMPKYRIESSDFIVSLNPDKNYSLGVEAAGYQNYTDKINPSMLATQQAFKKDVLMAEIIVEKPVLEVPKPIVQAPVAAEPKKVEVKETVTKVEPPKQEIKKPELKEPAQIKVEAVDVPKVVNIPKEKPEINKKYLLGSVMFEQSSPQLKTESYPQLDDLASMMKSNPNANIEIIGHTDNVGEYKLNLYLSEFRAKAIANYLYNKGIEPLRIKAIGKGQTEPIAPNDTEENRKKNRRVEIIVTEKLK